MEKQLSGIHHVTAIAGDPQRNVDFYAGLLGLRLVKLTVNFDDPGTYHLYYGDYSGQPGTILTFFPWRGVPAGRPGPGQMTTTSFSVPEGSLTFWKERLAGQGIAAGELTTLFGERSVAFRDPDGMGLELIEAADPRLGWEGGPIPPTAAIRGLYGATLSVASLEASARLLGETMGFKQTLQKENRYRFEAAAGGAGAVVDLVETAARPAALQGAGSVHHIAWRVADDAGQAAWRAELTKKGLGVSPVMDRKYFHSIYYREPSGILYEIATDAPGFAVDEPLESLGQHLVLPPWLEPSREELLTVLPKLALPEAPVREAQHA